MYEQFYGFYDSPFNITPDPRFLIFSGRHQKAFGHLLFGIKERKGFIRITGEVGTGKTTLSRALLEALNTFLLNQVNESHDAVLVIDEAQNLSPELLEQVRMLSNLEIEMYIAHRLRVVGANGSPTVTRGAPRRIYCYSCGVPRLINAVCDKALLCGYVEGEDHLTARHLKRAIRELEGKVP